MSSRQNRNKQKILEQLERIPIVSVACQKVGISRATYYRWLNEDNDFSEAVEVAQDKGYDAMNDVAESKVLQKVNEGDWKATKFWLESNKKRYYRPRRPIVHNHITEPRPVTTLVKFIGNDDEEYDSYQEYQEARVDKSGAE